MNYLFRDLKSNDNLEDGKEFHAAGIVVELTGTTNNNKDVAVKYYNPFKGIVEYVWRGIKEVELYECTDDEYTRLSLILLTIESFKY